MISDFYRVVGDQVAPKGDIDEAGPPSREEFAAHMMENPADFYYGVLRGLVSVAEAKAAAGGREKQLNVTFLPEAEPVLAELKRAYKGFQEARLSGLNVGEQARYRELTCRIQDNIREILR